jgi:DNA-directed RNA polymerase specialized sigma24 family protein
MQRILVEYARHRARIKRGGDGRAGAKPLPLDVVNLATEADPEQIVSLDDAICRLEGEDPTLAEIVRLRFYAGLSVEEAAAALAMSPATLKRRWAFARALLYRALTERTE